MKMFWYAYSRVFYGKREIVPSLPGFCPFDDNINGPVFCKFYSISNQVVKDLTNPKLVSNPSYREVRIIIDNDLISQRFGLLKTGFFYCFKQTFQIERFVFEGKGTGFQF